MPLRVFGSSPWDEVQCRKQFADDEVGALDFSEERLAVAAFVVQPSLLDGFYAAIEEHGRERDRVGGRRCGDLVGGVGSSAHGRSVVLFRLPALGPLLG